MRPLGWAASTLTLNTKKMEAIKGSCAAAMPPVGQDVVASPKRILTDGGKHMFRDKFIYMLCRALCVNEERMKTVKKDNI